MCTAEFNQTALFLAKVKCCPNCGSKQIPLKISEDGYVKLNWQEIRILSIYAQRWAATFDTEIKGNREALIILNRIIKDLYKYKPLNAANLDPMIESKEIVTAVKDRRDQGIPSPFFLLNKKF